MNKPRIPINRSNKFYSENEFDLDIEMGREALEEDNNFVVVLYRVDRQMTLFDDIYGETSEDGVRFKTPVELRVMPTIEEAANASYNPNGSQRNLEDGNLTFELYQKQLDELGVEITYGDYIGYAIDEDNVRYFSVANDGVKNYNNANMIMGYKSAFRKVVCTPVNKNEFKGL
jgi:hypothetical protein